MINLIVSAFAVLAFAPALASELLPLQHGRYSSTTCGETPNAALLTYDGQSLAGAHSAACTMRVVKNKPGRYSLKQTCPAEQVGGETQAREIVVTEDIVVLSGDSFRLSTSANSADARTFHRCDDH